MNRHFILLASFMLMLISLTATARLIPERTVVNSGDRIRVVAVHDLVEQGDIYVGFLEGAGLPLLEAGANGKFTPSFANVPLDTPILVLNMDVPQGIPPGQYIFYEIVTQPGSNPMDVNTWITGLSSLSQVLFHVNQPDALTRDFNHDGICDDDGNRDGFHDDDFGRNGFGGPIDLGEIRVPGLGAPLGLTQHVILTNTGEDPDASGRAMLRQRIDGRTDFYVQVQHLQVGTYELVVDGNVEAQIQVVQRLLATVGEVQFTSPNGVGELPFDPHGKTIQIKQGDTLFLTGDFPAAGTTVQVPAHAAVIAAPMLRTGLDPDAEGQVRFRNRVNGIVDFRVQIEHLAVGTYDLVVGNTVRAQIQVVQRFQATRGEVELRKPAEAGTLSLDFDPRGQTLQIRQGANVFLTADFPG